MLGLQLLPTRQYSWEALDQQSIALTERFIFPFGGRLVPTCGGADRSVAPDWAALAVSPLMGFDSLWAFYAPHLKAVSMWLRDVTREEEIILVALVSLAAQLPRDLADYTSVLAQLNRNFFPDAGSGKHFQKRDDPFGRRRMIKRK